MTCMTWIYRLVIIRRVFHLKEPIPKVRCVKEGAPACSRAVLGTTTALVSSMLPTPSGIQIVASATTITIASDPASNLPLATQAFVTIYLMFADGRRQEVTRDNRTHFSVADDGVRYRDGEVALLPAPEAGRTVGEVEFLRLRLRVTWIHGSPSSMAS